MRGKKLILLLMLAGLLQTGTSQSERQVRKFVRQQLSWYPHLHLIDLYKSCYQDFMGAEHLVTNSEVANYYVQKELSEMDTAAYVQGFLEPCGLYGNYMRVPLAFVKNGTVPADSLVSWFVQSSGAEPPHTLEEWMARWNKIERIIDQMDLQLPEYENDKATIRAIFERGGYASVHSKEFKQYYHPHYRIVSRKILRKNKKLFHGQPFLR